MSTEIGSEVCAVLWTHTHHHHQTIMASVCGGEASLIQQCPVAHQSYLPPPAFCLSKTVSLFSPHTSLPGNPTAFSWVFSFLTASPTAQTHSSPLDGERERRGRLVSQRQVPDTQPASQRNVSSATSCASFPSSLGLSVVCWGPVLLTRDTRNHGGGPNLPAHFIFCSYYPSFICSPILSFPILVLHHPDTPFMPLNMSLFFLSFRAPSQPEFPLQAIPQDPQAGQSWHTVLSTQKHTFSFS